jgi:hypothetical protein
MILCPDHGTTPTEGCCKPPCEYCNDTGMVFDADGEGFGSLEFCSCNENVWEIVPHDDILDAYP